jgi:hypothetical protein
VLDRGLKGPLTVNNAANQAKFPDGGDFAGKGTGVEFADSSAPPSPVQLARDEPLARDLFPLAERLERKEDMMRHGLASPDNGDALSFTFPME